jgi:hypothetical protein
VTSTGPNASPDAILDTPEALFVIEKGHMLFPWQTYHYPQTVALCCIKEPTRWYSIGANGVQAVVRYLGKVMLDGLGIMILIAIGIRAERSIGNTPDPQFSIPNKEKLPLRLRSASMQCARKHRGDFYDGSLDRLTPFDLKHMMLAPLLCAFTHCSTPKLLYAASRYSV